MFFFGEFSRNCADWDTLTQNPTVSFPASWTFPRFFSACERSVDEDEKHVQHLPLKTFQQQQM
jgi:hypothetical protein